MLLQNNQHDSLKKKRFFNGFKQHDALGCSALAVLGASTMPQFTTTTLPADGVAGTDHMSRAEEGARFSFAPRIQGKSYWRTSNNPGGAPSGDGGWGGNQAPFRTYDYADERFHYMEPAVRTALNGNYQLTPNMENAFQRSLDRSHIDDCDEFYELLATVWQYLYLLGLRPVFPSDF